MYNLKAILQKTYYAAGLAMLIACTQNLAERVNNRLNYIHQKPCKANDCV